MDRAIQRRRIFGFRMRRQAVDPNCDIFKSSCRCPAARYWSPLYFIRMPASHARWYTKNETSPPYFTFSCTFFTLLYQDQNSPIQDHTSTITLDASTITAYQKWLNSQKKLGADFTNQLPGYNNYLIFQH